MHGETNCGVRFHFNGDGSGDCKIVVPRDKAENTAGFVIVDVPVAALARFVANRMRDERIAALESASAAEILGVEPDVPFLRVAAVLVATTPPAALATSRFSMELLDAFDAAAREYGWHVDQGSDAQVAAAQAQYNVTRAGIVDLIATLERAARGLREND